MWGDIYGNLNDLIILMPLPAVFGNCHSTESIIPLVPRCRDVICRAPHGSLNVITTSSNGTDPLPNWYTGLPPSTCQLSQKGLNTWQSNNAWCPPSYIVLLFPSLFHTVMLIVLTVMISLADVSALGAGFSFSLIMAAPHDLAVNWNICLCPTFSQWSSESVYPAWLLIKNDDAEILCMKNSMKTI